MQEYLGAGAAVVVVDAAELLRAKAAWATHAANQLMTDIGPEHLLFDANSDAKVHSSYSCCLIGLLSNHTLCWLQYSKKRHCISCC